MLEDYFIAPWCLTRLRSSPMAPHIDRFTASLGERGYTRGRIRWALQLAARFSRYAESVGVDNVSKISERLTFQFLKTLPARTLRDTPRAMRHMLEHLRREGIVGGVDGCATGAVCADARKIRSTPHRSLQSSAHDAS